MKVHRFIHEMRQTSAIFGRESGVYVTFEGDGAFTDGKRINLPSMGLDKDLTTEQVMILRGYVDHEAGHVRSSDMQLILDFYKRCMSNGLEGLKVLHNCIEDVWMEHQVVKNYPGSKKNLAVKNRYVKAKEANMREEGQRFLETGEPLSEWDADTKARLESDPKFMEESKTFVANKLNGFTGETVGTAIKAKNPMFREDREHKRYFDLMPESIKKNAEHWADLARDCENTAACIELAKSIWQTMQDDPELNETTPDNFDPEAGSDFDPGEIDEEKLEKEGQPQEGVGRPSQDGKKGDPDKVVTEGPVEFNPDGQTDSSLESIVDEILEGGPQQDSDGPLKGGYRVLTTDHDIEYRRGDEGDSKLHRIVNSTDPTSYVQVTSQISGEISTMKAKLKRALLAKDRRGWDYGREAGRLDSKRLVAATKGLPNVYKQRDDILEENTVVTFLVDLSGSMSGTKVTVARDCVVAMTECLAGSNITFKVVGFSNNGRPNIHKASGQYHRYERLDTTVFKDFDQPMRTARPAVGQINRATGANNSDYDFIVNELNYLKGRREQRKVLFVLSDGSPACESDASTSEHISHCKKAIDESRRDGIECVGIGIQDRSVKRIYKDNVVVNNVNDLAANCFHKLTKILVGV